MIANTTECIANKNVKKVMNSFLQKRKEKLRQYEEITGILANAIE